MTINGEIRARRAPTKKFEYIEGDVRDAESVSSAMAGCNAIIHMAAINGTRNFYERPGLVLEVGTRGVLNVLDAARTTGCSELYFLSSSEVYNQPSVIPTPETVPMDRA